MGDIPFHIQTLLASQLEAARYGIVSMSPSEFAEYLSKNDEIDALLAVLQSGRQNPFNRTR